MLTRLSLATAVTALLVGAAAAQAPTSVVGSVKSISEGHVVITTKSGDVDLLLTPQTRVAARQTASPDDIKVGDYLGTGNVTTPEGGVATEVHLMATGPNVANTPMAQPNQVMTNGHVKAVKTTAKGKEMDVDYGGAETRHVIVAANTPVTRLNDAKLTTGASVIVRMTATGADGKPAAVFIQVVPQQ
jgi:hypothetical protein